MYGIPAAWARDWICLPVGPSSGSTSRTLAPAVISAWAIVTSVLVVPEALSILKSVVAYPAALNAWVRYGRS